MGLVPSPPFRTHYAYCSLRFKGIKCIVTVVFCTDHVINELHEVLKSKYQLKPDKIKGETTENFGRWKTNLFGPAPPPRPISLFVSLRCFARLTISEIKKQNLALHVTAHGHNSITY